MAKRKSTTPKIKAAAETPAKEVKTETTTPVDVKPAEVPTPEVIMPDVEGDTSEESNLSLTQEANTEPVPEDTSDSQASAEPAIDLEAEAKKEKARYKGKVRLSNVDYDTIDKKEAKKLVEESQINQHYKNIMLIQIDNGALTHQYAESLKRIRSAANSGTIYRPGTDGL